MTTTALKKIALPEVASVAAVIWVGQPLLDFEPVLTQKVNSVVDANANDHARRALMATI